MARFIAQIIIAGTQVVVRAFARAVRQEMEASRDAARRLGNNRSRSEHLANLKSGLSLEEAKQILDVSKLNKDEVDKRFDFLFKNNEKEKGGSFYIQSKIVRAKERIDQEFERVANENQSDAGSKT